MAVSATSVALVAGAGVAGVVAGCALTRTDGVREQGGGRRTGGGHFLVPTNKDTARATIEDERSTGTQLALAGAALAIGGSFVPQARAGLAAVGAGLFGAGAAKLVRLHGAEDRLPDTLPDHAQPGVADEYLVEEAEDVKVGAPRRSDVRLAAPATPTWTALGLTPLSTFRAPAIAVAPPLVTPTPVQ